MDCMIGIIGSDNDAAEVLYHGLKEFPAKRVTLIATPQAAGRIEEIKKDLAKFKIPVTVMQIKNPASLEEVFQTISRIKADEGAKIIINVDTDYQSSCLALSAAFVNGVQAIGTMNEKVIAYPIMKFSYYNALSPKKIKVMKLLHKLDGEFISFDQLSKRMGMSLPLMSYHINGNLKSAGLRQLGLVQINEKGNRKEIQLNMLGRLLIKGIVDFDKSKK